VAKVGLFTSTTEETTQGTCQVIFGREWRTLFNAILCCNTPGANVEKPQPEAFQYILKLLDSSPDRAVMVGDVPGADLVPAAMLGMITVQVERTDYPHAHLHIQSVTDIVNHIS